MFDFRREVPARVGAPASTAQSVTETEEPSRLPSPGTSAPPVPPVLTRPRSGAGGSLAVRRDVNEDGPQGGLQEQGGPGAGGADSITLGQLKAHAQAVQQKQKLQHFDFRYDDTDTLMSELDEFFPYVEMSNMRKLPDLFKRTYDRSHADKGMWTASSLPKRRSFVERQLELLESADPRKRSMAQQVLLYVILGNYGETTSPEMHLHWVIENAKLIRSVDGVASLVQGLRDATKRYNGVVDSSAEKVNPSAAGPSVHPVDPYDESSAELMDMLAMLYFVIEVLRSDETFGEELMTLSPPFPVTLFQLLASMKDRVPKGYPVKKLLLLSWKTLLACLGGMKEVSRARSLSRELAGLPPEEKYFTKSTPTDIASFRRDTSVKYPTFAPSTSATISVPNEKLAESNRPIPARPNYHSTEIPVPVKAPAPAPEPPTPAPLPQPVTPAPSPPLSPAGLKPKKQQFQTDPSKPFVFPFSRTSNGNPSSLVPFAIDEADRLYHRHAYIPLSLYQMWEMREECIREERGLGKRGLIGFSSLHIDDEEEGGTAMEAMRRDWRYEEEEQEFLANGDKEGAKMAREKRAASQRLHRVEVIYQSVLPLLQNCVIVLLKLLLATVTGPGAQNMASQNALPADLTSPAHEAPPVAAENPKPQPPPTREEVDVARHREITSKAVSAIIILMLKWFKASHVLKFHYFAQLLFDSNCLLLVLKMFGLSDVYTSVLAKNEFPDCTFFRYCYLNLSRNPPTTGERPEDNMPKPPKASPKAVEGEPEIEIIYDYSWRNFFSSINFVKILQKMTKHRSHRTFLLFQYKSSTTLKRMLRVTQPMLQLQVLKLIKSQMPWCGRKWRQTNMKVITSIYLNCRPELRDDWLGGTDQENELEDALPQEYALRSIIQFYNKQHYSAYAAHASPDLGHKRSNSISATTLEDPALQPPPPPGHPRSSSGESDVFPPRRSSSSDAMAYNPDEMIEFWLHEYEDVLGEVFGDGERDEDWEDFGVVGRQGVITRGAPGPAERDDPAWHRLGQLMQAKGSDGDGISDSESVASVGELGEDARLPGAEAFVKGEVEVEEEGIFSHQQRRKSGAGENTWEHMSPATLSLLPRSPAERRRSSAGASAMSPLRPLIPSGQGDADPFSEDDEDGVDLRGPMPIMRDTGDERERDFGAVDEVEYAYGE